MNDPFNEREQRAWSLISDAFEAVMELDERGRLNANVSEIAQGTHVLQSAVVQHMNHRIWPDQFSDWWKNASTPNRGESPQARHEKEMDVAYVSGLILEGKWSDLRKWAERRLGL